MLLRPIGPLVNVLRTLGAKITYLGREGFPPLRIEPGNFENYPSRVDIPATISSQFISALLLIAPFLPHGLVVHLRGSPVSRPYINMTLDVMSAFGISARITGNTVSIPAGHYNRKEPYAIEADWSAASYHYACCALASDARVRLRGLQERSSQGDAILPKLMTSFGITTKFLPDRIDSIEWAFHMIGGDSTSLESGIEIDSNYIDAYKEGISLLYQDAPQVSNNFISCEQVFGIYANHCYNSTAILTMRLLPDRSL